MGSSNMDRNQLRKKASGLCTSGLCTSPTRRRHSDRNHRAPTPQNVTTTTQEKKTTAPEEIVTTVAGPSHSAAYTVLKDEIEREVGSVLVKSLIADIDTHLQGLKRGEWTTSVGIKCLQMVRLIVAEANYELQPGTENTAMLYKYCCQVAPEVLATVAEAGADAAAAATHLCDVFSPLDEVYTVDNKLRSIKAKIGLDRTIYAEFDLSRPLSSLQEALKQLPAVSSVTASASA